MEKIKLLLYCTKQQPYLVSYNNTNEHWYLLREIEKKPFPQLNSYNGKIVAECDFEVEEIKHTYLSSFHSQYCIRYSTNNLNEEELSRKSCLKQYSCNEDEETLCNYLGENNGYAIHIKNLNIFDKPRELKWNYHISYYDKQLEMQRERFLTKAPQNMCRVFDHEHEYDCVLISIRPEWLCKILNGEKTIEIRKKVLKEMVK